MSCWGKLWQLGLGFLIQPLLAEQVEELVTPAPSEICVMTFEYEGRDEEGIPTWNYGEVCYEQERND